ncbi:MAG: hypothetical protein OEM82_08405, partial [Acidobacteriota bacterium]|nr:hypothetical protein [Acidobacteriota bacterium]
MKRLFAILLLAFLTVSVAGQGIRTDFDLGGFGVKINPDKRLIAVRASLELAGMRTELTKDGEQFRQRVLADFKDFNPDLRNKLKVFVDQYRNRHSEFSAAELASAFVSMSFTLSPAPGLEEPSRSADLPGELLEVLDYSPLVREFYRSDGVSAKIDEYVDEFQIQGEFVTPTARDMVRDVLEYLHTRPRLSYVERVKVETKEGKKTLTKYEPVERFRSFTIVPDLLQAKGNINFLNIRDEYIAIIPPRTDLSASEVRRAYLQFVLDPLVLNQALEIQIKNDEIKSLLNNVRKDRPSISPDPILAVSRSLVAATDIREEQYRKTRLATDQARRKIALMTTDEDRKAVSDELERVKQELSDESVLRLIDSYESGAILVFYFAEKLGGVEQSGFDVSGSIRNWLRTLEPKAEENRLEENFEASQRARVARQRRKAETVAPLIENPLTRALLDIDVIVDKKDYKEAESRLN